MAYEFGSDTPDVWGIRPMEGIALRLDKSGDEQIYVNVLWNTDSMSNPSTVNQAYMEDILSTIIEALETNHGYTFNHCSVTVGQITRTLTETP